MSGSFYSNDILSPDWIRSYPGGNSDDALTYTPKGFLWTAAEAKGLSARLYGEWSNGAKIAKKPDGTNYTWSDFYRTALCKEGKAPKSSCIVPDDAVSVTSDDSLGGQNHGPALSAVQSHDSRPVPNGLLDTRVPASGCGQSGSQSDDSLASGRPHRRNHKRPTLSRSTTRPTTIWRLAAWWKPSATARYGRNRRSSSRKTIPRAASITWMATVSRFLSSALIRWLRRRPARARRFIPLTPPRTSIAPSRTSWVCSR